MKNFLGRILYLVNKLYHHGEKVSIMAEYYLQKLFENDTISCQQVVPSCWKVSLKDPGID